MLNNKGGESFTMYSALIEKYVGKNVEWLLKESEDDNTSAAFLELYSIPNYVHMCLNIKNILLILWDFPQTFI